MNIHILFRSAAVAAVLLAAPAYARADFFLGGFGTLNTGGDTTRQSAAIGVNGGWFGSWFGGEGEAAWSPSFFDADGGFRTKHRAATVTATALGGPMIGVWRPYGAFGIGALRSEIEEVGALATLTDTRPALHAGGGVMWSMGRLMLRGDVRYIRALDDTEPDGNVFPETFSHFDFWRLGGGVAVRW